MKRLVYDLEQFRNFHSGIFYDIDTEEYHVFVVHPERNNITEYIEFLEGCKTGVGMIGYNNTGYDYPLLHFILMNKERLLAMPVEQLVTELYVEGQRIITEEHTSIPHWKMLIPQLDLFKLHHFNNKAKFTSLKHLQVAMRWENVQELPLPFDSVIGNSSGDMYEILTYNKNDVMSTYEFYKHSLEEIEFRKRIGKEYNMACINFPDVKIGEEILIIENAKALGISKKELKTMRTRREFIKLDYLILPEIKFKSKEFNKALDFFKSKTVHAMNTKKVLETSVIYDGVKYDFGLGGIHGTNGSGVHQTDEKGELILVDVSSYYPNLAIQNKFYPQHLSKTFCDVGDKLYQRRMTAKAEGDNQMVGAIKLALNGALFGKSNDEHSPMYDTAFMLRITINGQLLLCMLAERIADNGIPIIQINTDGILTKCPKDKRELLDSICAKWEKLTKLTLDYDFFKTVVQRDVNNYIGFFTDGKIKYKGAFAIKKAWNKDHSMEVVSQAVSDYYEKGTPIRKTITKCTDIYDFCISKKVGKQFKMEYHTIENGKKVITNTQRLNRFYITKDNGSLVKVKDDGSVNRMFTGHNIKLFNKYQKSKDYNIDYDFYVAEANKIINAVDDGQMSLF